MADWPIRSVLSKTSRSDGPISRVHEERQGALLVQSDSSGRTTRRTPRHTDKLLRLSHSKGFGASFGRTTRQKLRLSQSHPSDGSSFGRIFGSANHIHRSDYLRTDFLRTDHPSDESSAQPITSFGPIIFGRTFFGRIILQTNFRLSQSHPLIGLSSDGLSS